VVVVVVFGGVSCIPALFCIVSAYVVFLPFVSSIVVVIVVVAFSGCFKLSAALLAAAVAAWIGDEFETVIAVNVDDGVILLVLFTPCIVVGAVCSAWFDLITPSVFTLSPFLNF
jgi:hypothetical protein